MMACDKKNAYENSENATPAEETSISINASVTEQTLAVVPGMVSKEDEEQILSLIKDFTESAKNKDYESVLPYYAIESYIDGYNMEIAKENFGDLAIQPTIDDRIQDVASRYTIFVIGLVAEEMSEEGTNILNAEDLKGIANEIDIANLAVKRIDIPMVEVLTSDQHRNILTKQCNRYGSENITYRTVLYEIDGNTYYCGFTLYCYGGMWEIFELACHLVPMDTSIVTIPCNEKEYLEMIGEEL
jgi:hypothetical protein